MSQFGTNATPLLDARLLGIGKFSTPAGQTAEHTYVFTYDCKFNGIEVLTDSNVAFGDNITLWTEYNAGPYGWKRFKKFGKSWHVKKDNVLRIILFPTEPKAGVRLVLKYENTGATTVDIAVNLFTFVDQAVINTQVLEEGEDW